MPRATSAQEIFEAMPGQFNPEKAGNINAVVQFDLSGEGGGQWCATIADGKLTTAQGTAPNPSLTLSMSAADYVSIVNGDLNAMNAFMQGKVKVKGDMGLVMRLQSLFGGS